MLRSHLRPQQSVASDGLCSPNFLCCPDTALPTLMTTLGCWAHTPAKRTGSDPGLIGYEPIQAGIACTTKRMSSNDSVVVGLRKACHCSATLDFIWITCLTYRF